MTIKSSTIFISVGTKTQVFRSVNEVPPKLRRRLQESTTGMNSATILIADRKGREELIRAIQGKPTSLSFRVSTAARPKENEPESFFQRYATWFELGAIGLMGLALWAMFLWK
jgi:hypothetical protein